MNITRTILLKSLVWPFYRQNAGLFAFLIFIMVAAVGRANDAGLLEYHLSLIQAITTNKAFLIFTLLVWMLYALKCMRFTTDSIAKKENAFLSVLSLKKSGEVTGLLLLVQVLLLLPILTYAGITVAVGLFFHRWISVSAITVFFILLLLAGAGACQFILNRPGRQWKISHTKIFPVVNYTSYTLFLFRYLGRSRKLLFLTIKLFSCTVLFGLINQTAGDRSGLQMIILFYSFCLLGHGVLIYLIRHMEETSMSFYRTLPVSLMTRFGQYALFCFLLFVPEIWIICHLTPLHLEYSDAVLLILYGYGVLLFLISLLFIRFFSRFDYLKILTVIFLFVFISVLTGLFPALCSLLIISPVYIFCRYYYHFEKA